MNNDSFIRDFKSAFSFRINHRTEQRVHELLTEDKVRRNWQKTAEDLQKSIDNFSVAIKHKNVK